jgi:hypothetical protein
MSNKSQFDLEVELHVSNQLKEMKSKNSPKSVLLADFLCFRANPIFVYLRFITMTWSPEAEGSSILVT